MPYCDGKPRKTLETCNFLTASRDKTFVSRDESFVPQFREKVVTYFSDLHSTRGRSGCTRLQLQRKQMLKRLSTGRINWLKRKAITDSLEVAVVNLKMVKNKKLCMRCSFLKVRLFVFFSLKGMGIASSSHLSLYAHVCSQLQSRIWLTEFYSSHFWSNIFFYLLSPMVIIIMMMMIIIISS